MINQTAVKLASLPAEVPLAAKSGYPFLPVGRNLMERRASPRSPIRCQIECEAGTQTFRAQGFDISEVGIAFITPAALPVDTEALLRYRLDDDGPLITARVLITQQTEGRVGARFIERTMGVNAIRSA
jgi:hypothetical protein